MAGLTVSVPVSFDTSAGRGVNAVVESVLPTIMKRLLGCSRLNMVSEVKMREVLNNIVTNKVHIKLPPPYTSSNHPDAVLLYDALRSSCAVRGMNQTRELWRQFVTNNITLFDVVVKEVRDQRPVVPEETHLKRRRTGEAPAFPPSNPPPLPTGPVDPAFHDPLPPSGLPNVDTAELAVVGRSDKLDKLEALKMTELVLAFQSRPDFQTPPSSPRAAKVIVPTAADRLLRAHVRTRDTSNLTDLFSALDLDGSLVPDTYAPPFDRNDLYISNAAAVRDMYQRAASWTEGDGFLYHVLITYTGPMDLSKQPFTCAYVTWCWEEEVATFLSRVMTGAVRLNDDFTRLVDRVSKLHHGQDMHLHRFFNLSIVQTDIAPPASDADLPNFLCDLACVYNEMRSDRRDATQIGLNHSPLLFARHRLIYESGSLQNYRLTWMLIAAKKRMDEAVSQFEAAVLKAGRMLVTLQYELHICFQSMFGEVSSRTSQEVQVLAKLALDTCAVALALHKEAQNALKALQAVASEHNKHVQAAYAAARMEEFCNSIPVPRALLLLYNSVFEQAAMRQECERMEGLHTAIARIQRTVQSLWFMHVPGTTLEGGEKVLLLHALVMLKLWSAEPVSDELRTAPLLHLAHLPEPPPNSIRMKVVQKAYRNACLKQHPDRNKQNEAEATTRTQQIGAARTLIVNHLVPSSSRSRSLRNKSESGSSD